MDKLVHIVDRYEDPSHVFKSCSRDWIVVLRKLPDTNTNESRPVVDPNCAKFRADKLQVVDIINKFDQTTTDSICDSVYEDKQMVYEKGEIIEVKDFDKNVNIVCAAGIHYYKTMKVAFYLELERVIDGEWICWYENGQMYSKRTYKDGKPEGVWSYWYSHGQMALTGVYKNGEREREWISWYDNGQMKSNITYKDGILEGEYISWYNNGRIELYKTYKGGELEEEYNGRMNVRYTYRKIPRRRMYFWA